MPCDNDEPERYRVFQGDDGLWGVESAAGGGLLYEPDFCRATAEAIVDMLHSRQPPADWLETRDRLDRAGLPY